MLIIINSSTIPKSIFRNSKMVLQSFTKHNKLKQNIRAEELKVKSSYCPRNQITTLKSGVNSEKYADSVGLVTFSKCFKLGLIF